MINKEDIANKEIRMEGAPDWYGTPLDKLDFEWSVEEKLELERYCEKILKNIAEEEMTPKQRFEATMAGKSRDRVLIDGKTYNVYTTRTLDSAADALKPIDVYRNPKLLVKAQLATVARFALDYPDLAVLTYGEELWGGRAKMIELGNPVVLEVPIKSNEDLKNVTVPDPYKFGLYPGYLWICRELRRIFDEYGLTTVMPLVINTSPDPMGNVMLHMMGMSQTMIALRKDPELVKQCTYLCTEWSIRFNQAVIDVSKPDELYYATFGGIVPLKDNEWIVDEFAKVAKAVDSSIHVTCGLAFPGGGWLDAMYERGALGPGGWAGNILDNRVNYKMLIDFHREHDLYCGPLFPDKILLNGPISTIEDEIKERCEYGMPHPKFAMGIGVVDYWTPQSHLDAAMAAAKRYGKY